MKDNPSAAVIQQALNDGQRVVDIMQTLGCTRYHIDQIIEGIPADQLHIPCHYCGRKMRLAWAHSHKYHKRCAAKAVQRQGFVYRQGNQQRTRPDGEFESLALAAYSQRGYKVIWMPWQCSFDYAVNGLHVDVKGSNLGKSIRRFHFALDPNIADRCNIVHCIGLLDGVPMHYIIPAEEIALRATQIAINPTSKYTQTWGRFEDDWWRLEK